MTGNSLITPAARKSGYSVYNEAQKRRERRNDRPEMFPPLPARQYNIIYVDPPWHYGGKTQFDRSAVAALNAGYEKPFFLSAANFKYPTLKLPEMKRIPVAGIAAPDALLFMWTSSPHLPQALELGAAWDFQYRTVAFVWDKMAHNPGQYTMSYCELCLVFKRGRIPAPRGARNEKQLVRSPRREHSAKPPEVRAAIERMFPHHPRIELFAREKPDRWDVWGLEAPSG